ncbi:MAG TPA: formimidoylglutamate deiminase [Acidimicrobiales bacterium]|nr:formimidoylglutamate deiminase [Acidimicrobiales bacterium]
MTTWFAEWAWLGGEGLAAQVVLEDDGAGRLTRVAQVAPGEAPPVGVVRLPGIVLPGLANGHSHAFHRALRGRVQGVGADDFWRWRDRMYELAAVLDPDGLFDLARATYAEMALAGITAVGEFHYLHHPPGAGAYDDPNAMGRALVAAAAETGVRLTLLDACYLRGGFDARAGWAHPAQVRFGDGDVDQWASRVEALATSVRPRWRLGAAVHSVRAVDERAMGVVADWAARHEAPLHLHLAEQRAEVKQALAATGRTPARLAADAGLLGPRTVAVHATHVTDDDVRALGSSGTGVCLCPTTERDLGDGVGPAARLAAAGSPLSLGTDSHAVIDPFEEARLAELHERLVRRRRGGLGAAALLAAATSGGCRALGWADGGAPSGGLVPGAPADLVVVDRASARLAGLDLARHGAAGVVFAATAADVTDVVVGGRTIVRDRAHTSIPDVPAALHRAITSLWERV